MSLTARFAALLHIGYHILKSLYSVFIVWSLGPSLTIVVGIPSFTFLISSTLALEVCVFLFLLSSLGHIGCAVLNLYLRPVRFTSSALALDPLLSVRIVVLAPSEPQSPQHYYRVSPVQPLLSRSFLFLALRI